jgi:hypothetical protein
VVIGSKLSPQSRTPGRRCVRSHVSVEERTVRGKVLGVFKRRFCVESFRAVACLVLVVEDDGFVLAVRGIVEDGDA